MWIGESVVLCGMSHRKACGESSLEPEHLKPPQGHIQIMEWKREKGAGGRDGGVWTNESNVEGG